MRFPRAAVCVVLASLIPGQKHPAAAAVSCESLASLSLPNATVTSTRGTGRGSRSAGAGRGVEPARARNNAALCFLPFAVTSNRRLIRLKIECG